MSNPIDAAFAQKVQAARERVAEQRLARKFSPLTPAQDLALQIALSSAQYRFVRYLVGTNGTRSDEIARTCAIGNVSDTAAKAQQALARLGLGLACELIPDENRFGNAGRIGVWWLSVVDADRWKRQEAAA